MLIVYSIYFGIYRNSKVYNFRYKIIELCSKYDKEVCTNIYKFYKNKESSFYWFLHKYSYNQMIYSFKKLNLESWYSKEEINTPIT